MKKIALGFATCGLILSSCSSNDVFEDNQGTNNPNVINFSATTTRATVNNLGSLKENGGFPVYAVTTKDANGNNSTNWHIANKTYKFVGNSWQWFDGEGAMNPGPQWPKNLSDNNQMHFYAYYPAIAVGFQPKATPPTTTPSVTDAALTGAFTINGTAATQIDFLAANTPDIAYIPQGGSVPLAFKHITTKINFGVNAAAGTKVYVQQMNINNVKNTGTYDYTEKTSGNPTDILKNWTSTGFTMDGADPVKPAYNYWETSEGGQTTLPDPTAAKDVKVFAYTDQETTEFAKPFYENNTDNHLMLLPQAATPVWAPEPDKTNTSITPDEAYIGSVYRMEKTNGEDLVGYANASNHPNFNDLSPDKQNALKGNPLFVKVGFPLATGTNPTFSWIMGKAYTYNIMLGQNGSSGGYILDEHYYDQYGNPTDLTINGKDPGEPVSGGTINFDVTVEGWGADESTDIEGPQTQP